MPKADEPPPPSFVTARRLGCAGASAAIAAALSNPLELIKVRFQIEPAETRPASIFTFARRIACEEGIWIGLWRPGIFAWMAAMGMAFSGRMALFEPLKDALDAVEPPFSTALMHYPGGV